MTKKFSLSDGSSDRLFYWLKEELKAYYQRNYVFPADTHIGDVTGAVLKHLRDDKLYISETEIEAAYRYRREALMREAKAELGLHEERHTERVCFTNMCMVEDKDGNVVALEKVSGGYVGTTFPGGHLEDGETFSEAVVREVYEETGLTIEAPVFCGVYHWLRDGIRNVIFLYYADKFTGTLKGSDEGEVFWIPLREYRKRRLAYGMEQVLKIVSDRTAGECYMYLEDGLYRERLF